LLSIDIPNDYYQKEYITIFKDLLSLETIALGIYIPNPIEHYKLRSEGQVVIGDAGVTKVVTSHKSVFSKGEFDDIYGGEKVYNILKDNSYNDKAILDYVDINRSPLPIFITNPEPNFILLEGVQILVLYPNIEKRRSNSGSVKNKVKTNPIFKISNVLDERKQLFDILIERLQKVFDEKMKKADKKMIKDIY
jgi:hypothetical protein